MKGVGVADMLSIRSELELLEMGAGVVIVGTMAGVVESDDGKELEMVVGVSNGCEEIVGIGVIAGRFVLKQVYQIERQITVAPSSREQHTTQSPSAATATPYTSHTLLEIRIDMNNIDVDSIILKDLQVAIDNDSWRQESLSCRVNRRDQLDYMRILISDRIPIRFIMHDANVVRSNDASFLHVLNRPPLSSESQRELIYQRAADTRSLNPKKQSVTSSPHGRILEVHGNDFLLDSLALLFWEQ